MKIFNKLSKIILTSALLLVFSLANIHLTNNVGLGPVKVEAGLQDDLDKVQQRLAEVIKEKQGLQKKIKDQKSLQGQYSSEIKKLQDEVDLLDLQISEKKLKIDELALQIDILQTKIEETESSIIDSEVYINDLEIETDGRLKDMYMEQKVLTADVAIVFTSSSTDGFIKNAQYKKAIQEDINNTLEELDLTKKNLENEKTQQQDDKNQLEKDKAVLDAEKSSLETDLTSYSEQKSYYNNLLNKSQGEVKSSESDLSNLSKEEQELQAKLELLKQQIFKSFGSIPNGARILAGTQIGWEGMTGVATGPHLHFMVSYNGVQGNPCSYLTLKTLRNTICGVGNPKITTWPMGGTPTLTSGYGYRNGSFHNAIDLASGTGNAPIYAAHDGWIQFGNDGACSWYRGSYPCNGAGAKYAIICEDKTNCSKGLKTMYLHMK